MVRILWLCLVLIVVATGLAVRVLAPSDGGDRELAVALATRPADVAGRRETTNRLRPPPEPPLEPLPAITPSSQCPPTPSLFDELMDAQCELSRLQGELTKANAELLQAKIDRSDLLQGRCRERFKQELEAWLDGPLEPLIRADSELRDDLGEALTAVGEALGGADVWDQQTQRWYPGDCPEEIAALQSRLPYSLIAQLAGLFRARTAELGRLTPLHFRSRSGHASDSSLAVVGLAPGEVVLPSSDPLVKSICIQRWSIDQDAKQRINSLLGLAIYELTPDGWQQLAWPEPGY